MPKSDLIDVTVRLHAMTDHAVRVSSDGYDKNAVCIPLSQIEALKRQSGFAIITMPEWLALEKGLI